MSTADDPERQRLRAALGFSDEDTVDTFDLAARHIRERRGHENEAPGAAEAPAPEPQVVAPPPVDPGASLDRPPVPDTSLTALVTTLIEQVSALSARVASVQRDVGQLSERSVDVAANQAHVIERRLVDHNDDIVGRLEKLDARLDVIESNVVGQRTSPVPASIVAEHMTVEQVWTEVQELRRRVEELIELIVG